MAEPKHVIVLDDEADDDVQVIGATSCQTPVASAYVAEPGLAAGQPLETGNNAMRSSFVQGPSDEMVETAGGSTSHQDCPIPPELAEQLGLGQANPTPPAEGTENSAAETGKPKKKTESRLFTPKFFSDMADEILANFPYNAFAASHGCSTENVSRALMATVVNTLVNSNNNNNNNNKKKKNADGSGMLEEDDFQTQMATWNSQYEEMVRMLEAGGDDAAFHMQLEQAVAANVENESHGNAGNAGDAGVDEPGNASVAIEIGDVSVMVPAQSNHGTKVESIESHGNIGTTSHHNLAQPTVDTQLVDPQLTEGAPHAPAAAAAASHRHLQLSEGFNSDHEVAESNSKKRSRSEKEEAAGDDIAVLVPEFPQVAPPAKKRRTDSTFITRACLQTALRNMSFSNSGNNNNVGGDPVRNVSETLAWAMGSVTKRAAQQQKQAEPHAPVQVAPHERHLRYPEISRRKRMYRDPFGSYMVAPIDQEEQQRQQQQQQQRRFGGLQPPDPCGTSRPYGVPPKERTPPARNIGLETKASGGKSLYDVATKKDREWWERTFKGKK